MSSIPSVTLIGHFCNGDGLIDLLGFLKSKNAVIDLGGKVEGYKEKDPGEVSEWVSIPCHGRNPENLLLDLLRCGQLSNFDTLVRTQGDEFGLNIDMRGQGQIEFTFIGKRRRLPSGLQ